MSDDKGELSERARMRFEQVVDAASACFRRNGFHGASIAEISKAAGMSAGHIYHFFANKEAIIAAIVNRHVEYWIGLMDQMEASADPQGAIIDRLGKSVAERTETGFVGLWLEILAEAARNPHIGAVVQEADRRVCAKVLQLLQRACERRGLPVDLIDDGTVEVVMALFEGITNRTVLNPEFDRQALRQAMQFSLDAIYLRAQA